MNELNLRVASFLKLVSMLMVLGSLIYMYGYSSDRIDFINKSQDWIVGISKSYVFYGVLCIFGIFNVLSNVGISIYKSAEGYNNRSLFFKSELHKERIIMWFTYLIVGFNILITCSVLYFALIRINGIDGQGYYIFIPGIGLLLLIVIVFGFITALFRK